MSLLDPRTEAGTHNVASGHAVPMAHVLELLLSFARCAVEVEQRPERMRRTEIPVACGDASKLRGATGWKPEIPLEQTLADALEHARKAVTATGSATA